MIFKILLLTRWRKYDFKKTSIKLRNVLVLKLTVKVAKISWKLENGSSKRIKSIKVFNQQIKSQDFEDILRIKGTFLEQK